MGKEEGEVNKAVYTCMVGKGSKLDIWLPAFLDLDVVGRERAGVVMAGGNMVKKSRFQAQSL